MAIHDALTNSPSDGAAHQIHSPGYSVADVATMSSISTGSAGDLCFVQSSGSYYAYTGSAWLPLSMGGGGAPTTTPYVTTASDSGLSAEVTIPGLAGHPDIKSSGSNDDEFDALSGWTTLGSLDTSNVTDFKSHWHAKNTNIGYAVNGIYKAIPDMPFTVTAKLSDFVAANSYVQVAIILAESSPGKLLLFGPMYVDGATYMSRCIWTNRTTRTTVSDLGVATWSWSYAPIYLRLVATSSTDVVCQVSGNGFLWRTLHATVNPGFTVGNVGLVLAGNTAGTSVEAVFDWIRFS